MEKENSKNKGKMYSLVCLYPILMIGAYFVGRKILFYIGVIPLLFLEFGIIKGQFKYGNWKYAVFAILVLVIVSEIGYLLSDSIIDGICLGLNILIIVGAIQFYYKKLLSFFNK